MKLLLKMKTGIIVVALAVAGFFAGYSWTNARLVKPLENAVIESIEIMDDMEQIIDDMTFIIQRQSENIKVWQGKAQEAQRTVINNTIHVSPQIENVANQEVEHQRSESNFTDNTQNNTVSGLGRQEVVGGRR